MHRILILSILIFLLIFAGLVTLRGDMFALALPMIVYIFLGIVYGPREINVEITRTLSAERTPLNTPVTLDITISNLGKTLEYVLLEDQISSSLRVLSGKSHRMVRLPKDGKLKWRYVIEGSRGCYQFPKIKVTASDHLSVLRKQVDVKTSGRLFILPPITRLRHVYIRPRRTLVYSGNIPARQGGPGVEFFGVREYKPGDPPQWINWHASARYPDTLYCNEFEQEHVTDVGIILDGRRRTNLIKNHSIFDHSIIASATLADSFLSAGNRVGMLLYGTYLQWTFPGYGKQQRERILQELAQASVGESLAFADLANLPTRLFPADSQLVIVSPLHEDDLDVLILLRSRGYQVMVVSPDPLAFELEHYSGGLDVEKAARVLRIERDLLLTKLFRAGVQVMNWDVSKPFDRVFRAALGRPLAWMQTIRR